MSRQRVGVVTPSYGDSWNELDFVARRIAAGLAHSADVEVVVVAGDTSGVTDTDGAVTVRKVRGWPDDEPRRLAIRHSIFGPGSAAHGLTCQCEHLLPDRPAAWLPAALQEELALAARGRSPDLVAFLQDASYDAVVFVDWSAASTLEGIRALRADVPVSLLPFATPDPAMELAVYDEVFSRPRTVLALSENERTRLLHRRGVDPEAVVLQRIPLRINPLAHRDVPPGYDGSPTVVLARDWRMPYDVDELYEWSQRLTKDVSPDLRFRQVGPGTETLHWWVRVLGSESRTDVWRWMAVANVVVDATPHVAHGREVLEAMLLGSPVLVSSAGGATREYAEEGNGGLWFGGYEELAGAIAHLLANPQIGKTLGEQGRRYAEELCGGLEEFALRLGERVLA